MKKLTLLCSFLVFCFTNIFSQTWNPVIDTNGGFNWTITAGAVRTLKYTPGLNALAIGGEFDSLKGQFNVWSPPFLLLEPNDALSGIDCAPEFFNSGKGSVWATATMYDTSTASDFLSAGGKFNYCGCSIADPQLYGQSKNLQVWDLSWGYINTTPMDQMDTVFALSMTDNRTYNSICPVPAFKTYIGAKRTFCSTSPAYCDSTSYIGMFDAYQGCNYITDRNYMAGGTNGPVYAIDAIDTGNVYVGGVFDSAGSVKAMNIAKWNGVSWDSLGGGVNGKVRAITYFNNKIYVGGDFTVAGTVPAKHLAVWDGIQWAAIGVGTNGPVYTLKVDNGNLYVGGTFTIAGSTPVNNVAKWNGSQWLDLASGRNNSVYALEVYQNELYAGGNFTGGLNDTARFIARYKDSISGGLSMPEYISNTSVSVFPNPSTGSFTISLKNTTQSKYRLAIYNIMGECVFRSGISSEKTEVDLKERSNGIYFVEIFNSKERMVSKMILNK